MESLRITYFARFVSSCQQIGSCSGELVPVGYLDFIDTGTGWVVEFLCTLVQNIDVGDFLGCAIGGGGVRWYVRFPRSIQRCRLRFCRGRDGNPRIVGEGEKLDPGMFFIGFASAEDSEKEEEYEQVFSHKLTAFVFFLLYTVYPQKAIVRMLWEKCGAYLPLLDNYSPSLYNDIIGIYILSQMGYPVTGG